ncbi:MAG: methylated-DNA--[protein]-cysteine S-methyltransferase [Candidatus Limnocylindrales bacterium]|jgi:AraC family transcriptional regulator of adaptative response/methylated-DNA-[protein]-cysteine methyltransferase
MNESKRLSAIGRPPTEAEWAAISNRRAVPPFLFVVTSTGIICTPGCPARVPGRDRVRVVSGFDEGLAAGARACLRCRPDRLFGAETTPVPDPVGAAVARMSAALADGDVPSDRELAGGLGLPERRLRELFRASLGVTPRAWLASRRAESLRSRLADGHGVTEALYDAGYGSSSAAYEAANGELGMTPGRYRTGAAGESIRWTIAPIPEGVALVAATERGVCAVRLGDETAALAAELRSEFPRAELARDDAGLAGVASIVSDLAVGRRRPEADTLPLDVHATAFRRRVWEALRRIPFGETRSYGQIAAAVGAPGAARAVGTACALNPVAVVVPCHRVVGSDGSLHGYAYGLARKRQLLDAEASGAAEATHRGPDPDARTFVAATPRGVAPGR